jgi:metal-sulfur cluster biosynthetic enzyme
LTNPRAICEDIWRGLKRVAEYHALHDVTEVGIVRLTCDADYRSECERNKLW